MSIFILLIHIVPISMISIAACAPSANAMVEVTSQNLKSLLEARNAKVSATKFEMEAATERQGLLARSFLPSIEAYGGQESFQIGRGAWSQQPVYGIEGNINIFNGGRDRLENDVRGLDVEKKKFQGQRVLSEELEKSRTIYWQILYLKEKAGLLTSALEVNRQDLSSARQRIRNGVATDSDRFEFEMKDVDLRRDIAANEVNLSAKRQLLAYLLGLDAGRASLSFPENLAHDHDYETLLKHSLLDHEFLFKEQEIRAQQLQLNADRQSRVWWPRINVFAAYNQFNEREKEFPDARDRTESVFGLRAVMGFPAGWESDREAAALRKESMSARALVDDQKQEIEVHLRTEMTELAFLHDQVHEAEENIQRAERYYQLTRSEYRRGVKNSSDMLGASEKLFGMRHKRIEIIRDFQVSKGHVLSKIGK